MSERQIRTSCSCGWEANGPEGEVVAATIDHGLRVHNMAATAEQVLERAEVVEEADGIEVAGA
jgi:predicted small metal-binding protein